MLRAVVCRRTVAYNVIGNITSEPDIGTYSYLSAGPNRPHAVSSITSAVDGLTHPSYSYGANGNPTCVVGGQGAAARSSAPSM